MFLSNIYGPASRLSLLRGYASWVETDDHLLWCGIERDREAKRGMELKDGTLFVIFRQFSKGFDSRVTDETCDSRDSGAHRPRKDFAC